MCSCPAERFVEASRLLTDAGFVRRPTIVEPGHAVTFDRADLGQSVDLHHTIPGVTVDAVTLWRALEPHVRDHHLDGAPVPGLDRVGTTLHAVLHVAQGGKAIDKARRDVEHLLPRADVPWDEAAELAARLGAAVPLRVGFERVAGGAPVAERLGLPEASALDRASGAPGDATKLYRRLASLRPRERVRAVAHIAAPAPDLLRRYGPAIARRGVPGLAVAYVLRWLRLTGRLLRTLPSHLARARRSRPRPRP